MTDLPPLDGEDSMIYGPAAGRPGRFDDMTELPPFDREDSTI
jgi:hypothetical protein